MSQIPTFQSQVSIARPDTSGDQAIAGAIGQVGGQLGEFALKMQQVKNSDEANTLAIESHDEAAQILSDTSLINGGNLDVAEADAIRSLDELRSSKVASASNSRVRESLTKRIGVSIAQSQASVRGHFNNLRISNSKAITSVALSNIADEYIKSRNPKVRALKLEEARDIINSDAIMSAGEQALAMDDLENVLIPRKGKAAERDAYAALMNSGNYEGAVYLIDSAEYLPPGESLEIRSRAVRADTLKSFKDGSESLHKDIDPKDTSKIPLLLSKQVHAISSKDYIHMSKADIAVELLKPRIESAAENGDKRLYPALINAMPKNVEGTKIKDANDNIYSYELARGKGRRDATKELVDIFVNGGSLGSIPHDSDIVNKATAEYLALGGSLEKLFVRYTQEGKRPNKAMARALDSGLEVSATPEELSRSMDMLLIVREVGSDDQAGLIIDGLKNSAFARVLYDASKNASSEEDILRIAKTLSSEKARIVLFETNEALKLAGSKNSKGKTIKKLYKDDYVFGGNGRPSPSDRSTFESAYLQASVEVAKQSRPDTPKEDLRLSTLSLAKKIWYEDNTIVRIWTTASIFDRDPMIMIRKTVKSFVFNGSTQNREEAIASFEKAINQHSEQFIPFFKTEVQTGAAFETHGGVFMPITSVPSSDSAMSQVGAFMRWDAANQKSEVINRGDKGFEELEKVMKIKTDPRRLKPHADIRWDESRSSNIAAEADPELPEKIVRRFQEVWLKRKKGRRATTERQKDKKADELRQFANRLGWVSIGSVED